MRRVKPALARSLLVAVALGSAACRETTARDGRGLVEDCRDTVVRPQRQRVVVWNGAVLDEKIPCEGRARCVIGGAETRVYRANDDALVVEVAARSWQLPWQTSAPSLSYAALGNAIAGAHAVAVVDDEGMTVLSAQGEQRFPLPALLSGLRSSRPVVVEDGVGLWLVTKEGRPPKGLPFLWLRPPSSVEARGPDNAAPLLDPDGTLEGHIEQVPGGWRIHRNSDPQTLFVSSLSMPASSGQGSAAMIASGRRLTVYERGTPTHRVTLEEKDHLAMLSAGTFLLSAARGLERVTPRGSERLFPRTLDEDLAGNPLPDRAVVERVLWSHDERRRIAAIERLRLPGCRIEDRVHVLDVQDGSRRTIASGEAARLHPTFARGALHFIEAEVSYDFVGDG